MLTSSAAGKLTLRALALLVAVASGVVVAAAQKPDGWVRVEPEGEGFFVEMPSKPQPSAEELPLMGNIYQIRMYTSAAPDGVVYVTLLQELPTIAAALPPRQKLDEFMVGFKKGLDEGPGRVPGATIELRLKQELELKGHFGHHYSLSIAETPGLVRVYDGGRRVYVLMVLGVRAPDASVKRFLNSFDIKDAAPPKPKGSTAVVVPHIIADPVLFPPDNRPIPYGDPKQAAPRVTYGQDTNAGQGGNVGGGDRVPYSGGGGPGNTGPIDYDRTFNSREVTRKARMQVKPEPDFTEEARRNEVNGTVKLRMVLGKDGNVSNISVIEGLPDGLTEKAIEAAKKIQFTPAQKDGRAVSQWVTVEYNFNNYDDESNPAVTKAVILEKPEPVYTDEARQKKIEGTVVLEVFFSRTGEPRVINVISGLPHGLTEQAVAAVKQLKFKPAEIEGRPVSVMRTIEYVFSLK